MYSINGDGSQTSGALLQLITEGTEASAPGFWGNGSNFPGGASPDGGGGFFYQLAAVSQPSPGGPSAATPFSSTSLHGRPRMPNWWTVSALAQIPANAVSEGFSQYLGTPGITLGPAGPPGSPAHVYLVLDAIQIYANASDLAAGIEAGGIGNFLLGATPTIPVDILVAYSTGTDINIADVHIHGTSANTASDTITASDMVQLVGLTSLANLGYQQPHQFRTSQRRRRLAVELRLHQKRLAAGSFGSPPFPLGLGAPASCRLSATGLR